MKVFFWTFDNAMLCCVYLSACFLVTLSKRGWAFVCIVAALVCIDSPVKYSQARRCDCTFSISLKIHLSQINGIKSVGSYEQICISTLQFLNNHRF